MRYLQARTTRLLVAFAISLTLTAALWRICALAAPLSPTVVIVTNTNDSGPGSLRAALTAVNAGDVVEFNLPANSTITLTSGELAVHRALTIDGSSALNLTVSGKRASRVLLATAPLTIRDLTITDGNASEDGGGILATAALTLTRVRVVNNKSDSSGGGVYVEGVVALRDSLFQQNTSQYSGGDLRGQSSVEMTATLFVSNTTAGLGGGAFALGPARLAGGAFYGNRADYSGGGGLYAYETLEESVSEIREGETAASRRLFF